MSTTTAAVDIEMDSKPAKKDMPFDPFSLPIFFLCIGILGCTVSNMVNLGEAKDGVMRCRLACSTPKRRAMHG